MTKRLILGTAGHIDHGKSSLVLALTGVDPDRLKEEKQRGITIELGFAELNLGDLQVGVVDVPGHEKFVRMMVAGATGIDLVVLVIAADEGVMPQTREHLAICSLLGVKQGLIAISKVDLVEPDWLELVEDDILGVVEGSFLEDAPILKVSATEGTGLEELKQELIRLGNSTESKAVEGLMRLPVDRVFEMRGFGPVVTGTLVSGTLQRDEQVTLLPGHHNGRVRGLQVHGSATEEALAGQRTAVNIQGVDLEHIHRGQVVVHTDALDETSMFDAKIQWLSHMPKPLKHRAPLLLHTGTVQVPCRVLIHNREPLQPGESTYVRIQIQEPTVLLPSDRIVLRGFQRLEGHGTTVGGGVVLDPFPVWRRKDPGLADRLARLEEGELDDHIALLTEDAGPAGLSLSQLSQRTGFTQRRLQKSLQLLLSRTTLVMYEKEPPRYIHKVALDHLAQALQDRLTTYHEEFPLEEGMPREALREQLRIESLKLFSQLLQRLTKDELIAQENERVRLASHKVRFAEQEAAMQEGILTLYVESEFQPPRARDLSEHIEGDPEDIQSILELLTRQRQLIRVHDDLFFHAEALLRLKDAVIKHLLENETIDAQQFKSFTGASRKFTIPLAEYFDKEKITVRSGDVRKLRRTFKDKYLAEQGDA